MCLSPARVNPYADNPVVLRQEMQTAKVLRQRLTDTWPLSSSRWQDWHVRTPLLLWGQAAHLFLPVIRFLGSTAYLLVRLFAGE